MLHDPAAPVALTDPADPGNRRPHPVPRRGAPTGARELTPEEALQLSRLRARTDRARHVAGTALLTLAAAFLPPMIVTAVWFLSTLASFYALL